MMPRAGLRASVRAPVFWAFASGAATGVGQAPWGLWGVTVAALAVVAVLVARAPGWRGGALRAWVAGTGGFVVALSWIVEPFFVDAARHGWMAPFALIVLTGGLALFWGAAGALASWAVRAPVARVWAFALCMLAFEALRGVVFTGFPWALVGHVWIGTPVDQIAAIGGPLALSALSLGAAAGLATGWLRRGRRRALGPSLAALAVAASWAWGAARLAEPAPEAPGIPLRIVQPNVPQHLKWDPAFVEEFYLRHLELTQRPAETAPALVVWPESAAPFRLENPGFGLRAAAQAAGGVPVILGIDRSERNAVGARLYYNSLVVLDPAGEVAALYDKHHLVPFGEYIPLLGPLAEARGWSGLAARALSGYTPGPGPALLDLGPLGHALPLICYEAVFPRNLHTETRPDWIVQITNDAWFGTRAGPFQHLAQARLRAIEQGLPLVRAANTGVSAVIDARGRLVAQLGLGEMGIVDADLPGARAPTPYARIGDTPWHLVLAVSILALILRRRRTAVRPAIDAKAPDR
ncbi:MAG: apolipoprotein N-acyltransferase [Pararhodobacter sp.]